MRLGVRRASQCDRATDSIWQPTLIIEHQHEVVAHPGPVGPAVLRLKRPPLLEDIAGLLPVAAEPIGQNFFAVELSGRLAKCGQHVGFGRLAIREKIQQVGPARDRRRGGTTCEPERKNCEHHDFCFHTTKVNSGALPMSLHAAVRRLATNPLTESWKTYGVGFRCF